jgi:hypothetical protein
MRTIAVMLLFFVFPNFLTAQDGFSFQNHKNKIVLPFQLINNLVFIPIKVNGVELNFLLDTGVDETILFSLEDKADVRFKSVEKIKFRGLGTNEPVEGLKSPHNTLSIPNFVDTNHEVYIVLDQEFNFSSQIGIPVNGIIGYHFFKKHFVEIDYDKKRLTVYNETKKTAKRLKNKFSKLTLSMEKNKPYLTTSVTLSKDKMPVKLLLDTGNSDAVWLFPNISELLKVPEKNFEDFLGRGLSGDIFGKRGRINSLALNDYEMIAPIVSFPYETSLLNVNFVNGRVGSIGGDVFKRFVVVFDYTNSAMFLKRGNDYDEPFNYNMSGIEVQHQGLQWIQETVELGTASGSVSFDSSGEKLKNDFKYKFSLKPLFSISNIRKDSPAEICGLKKGDLIISINKAQAYRYSLQQVTEILKSEDGRWIVMEVERDNVVMKFRFQLKSLL